MPKPGITLWRSKGKKGAKYLAGFKGADGKRVVWSTGETDYDAGLRRAVVELGRRLQGPEVLSSLEPPRETPPVEPDHVAPPITNGTNGHARRPLNDILARTLYGGAAPAATPAPATPAAPVHDEAVKVRRLYEYFGKAMAFLTEGGLKRAVRFAGKEPEEMDDDEIELVREGWMELGEQWFGKTTLGPAGKVALGTIVAGVGMYVGGKPLPKPKELAAANDNAKPTTPAEGAASA